MAARARAKITTVEVTARFAFQTITILSQPHARFGNASRLTSFCSAKIDNFKISRAAS
jgi:hypothetical protein